MLKASRFVLDHEGLQLGSWNHKLPFKEIAAIDATVNNGVCTMTLTLNEEGGHPSTHRWRKGAVKKVRVLLSIYKGGHEAVYGSLYRYWEVLKS